MSAEKCATIPHKDMSEKLSFLCGERTNYVNIRKAVAGDTLADALTTFDASKKVCSTKFKIKKNTYLKVTNYFYLICFILNSLNTIGRR